MTIKSRLILDNLKTVLESITVANGYNTGVANVFRHTRTWNEVDTTLRPALCIHEGDQVSTEYQPADRIRIEFTVDVIGYIAVAGEDERINALHDLLDDLWTALHLDQTRGSVGGEPNAVSTSIVNSQTDLPDECGQESVRVTLRIIYFRTTGAS